MGLILDSSVVIAAERRGDTVERLIERVVSTAGDQDAALSAVGLTHFHHNPVSKEILGRGTPDSR